MEVTQSTAIKLTSEEFDVLTKFIHDLYDIDDTDEYVGQVMSDIYNARKPRLEESKYTYEGYVVNVIITR